MKNSSDTIGNRTRDLPTCSAVPQPTALPRAPNLVSCCRIKPVIIDPELIHGYQEKRTCYFVRCSSLITRALAAAVILEQTELQV